MGHLVDLGTVYIEADTSMALQQVNRRGQWIEERMLGSGGFGAVHLWKNEETDEKLALKRCRLQNEMTDKHRQRWQLEVQIMGRLEHENVIAALEVPKPLDVHKHELPLLAMEYCSGGDLRKVLNRPQSCCGLREFAIRCLVKDIASAVEYLHGNKIIHRDLKPENIVLKPVDEKIVYKIIDLGYAKELDQGSVCTSFVGTLQYLAPELFASQMYTCTVDYWSFGTVLFECITGYRPFLPTIPPFKWHHEVKQKTNDDICAMFDSRGEIKFHKVIPTTNNLSRSMQTYLEQWLRLMLRWDPKARGGGLAKDKRPACFTMLDNILAMKIIYVFHVANNELLTFPVVDQHTMLDLHRRIEEETHIPVKEQDIILGTGVTPEHDKPAAMCWLEPCEDDTLVYLFRKGGTDFGDNSPKKYKAIPPAVQTIVKDPSIIIPFEEQKKAWAESVHFCEEQFRDFRRMILSQRAAMLSLLRNDSIFVKTKNTMINDMDQLLAKIQYFKASLDHDVMFYKQLEKEQGMSSDNMFSKWKKMDEDVDSFKNMKVKVAELEQKASVVQTKIVELQRSPFARSKQDDTLDKFSKEARDAYSEFRASARDNKEALRDQKPMVTIIVKCILHRDKKLADLFAHLSKICSCKKDIDELLPQIEKCVQDINTNSEKLISYQKQRQTSVWRLLEVALHQNKQSQAQTPTRAALHVDTTLVCRQESKASNGSGNGTATIFQSSPNLESMKVMEDSKTTNKKFEETLSSLIQEHEEFASLISEV